jgi:hypothetical protein
MRRYVVRGRARGGEPEMKILPDDPLVRWVFWFMVTVSIVIPIIVAVIISL